jgi:pumilio RNA-binding family
MLTRIILTAQEDPIELCKNMHGTRSIQKIIEVIFKPKHTQLIKDLLESKIQPLSREINGNHVI